MNEENEFNPSTEVTSFPDSECYGLDPETYFRLFRTCSAINGLGVNEAFSITVTRTARAGCEISFCARRYAFSIEVYTVEDNTFTKLRPGAADRARASEVIFEGRDEPEEWEALLRVVARTEGVGLHTNLAFNLRSEWSAYLRAQQRLADERGF
jgi:hypothetical protein